jgi:hypothetical protein
MIGFQGTIDLAALFLKAREVCQPRFLPGVEALFPGLQL